MFENILDVNWENLSDHLGSAKDIPKHLRDLASTNESLIKNSARILFDRLYGQGDYCSASIAVVPFLFEILKHPDTIDLAKIWSSNILLKIATGGDFDSIAKQDPITRLLGEWQRRSNHSDLARGQIVLYHEVLARLPSLVPFVLARNGWSTAYLLYFLSWFPHSNVNMKKIFDTRFQGFLDHADSVVQKANDLLCLATWEFNSELEPSKLSLAKQNLHSTDTFLRYASFIYCSFFEFNKAVGDGLIEILRDDDFSEVYDLTPFCGGELFGFAYCLLERHGYDAHFLAYNQ